MKFQSSALLERPEGGSINEIRFGEDTVVKSYSGPIARGYQKLREEYYWLSSLPAELVSSFTKPVLYTDAADPHVVELHLVREPKVAVAKGILRGQLCATQTGQIVQHALRFLTERLYPLRGGPESSGAIYRRYHGGRLALAVEHLRKHPVIGGIIEAKELTVNGLTCPPVSVFLSWLEDRHEQYFAPSRMVAMHGDTHLDNILTSTGWDTAPELTFIDPRGDLVGPPHYDFAKLLKALEGHYDVIHYGRCAVGQRQSGCRTELYLEVDRSFDRHYARGLEAALAEVPAYADAEGVCVEDFIRATLVAECAHVLSFSFYHAYAPEPDVDRVRAYLAIFALMARRLTTGQDHLLAGEPLLRD
ncbi:phosphotransferase [Amycolatopsis anabasis]|uniref:phosphotransferase n=1 Tax=Amycolatopsis anabasis TaxID=1840409 RepID=UPI00131E7920|nr:phosphotransferase [Amycolatopsis anabasis]